MHQIQNPMGLVGPGTQPAEEDGAALDYLPMPKTMGTYSPPNLPEPEVLPAFGPALALLARLQLILAAQRVADPPVVLDLSMLDAGNREFLEQTLGDGEVSALITGRGAGRVQETRLAGVWWVRLVGVDGAAGPVHLEVADLPALVRAAALHAAADQAPIPDPRPAGVMNAPGVLAEVNAQVAGRQGGAPPHIVNLTLLPQTPEDLSCLAASLGTGPVTLLSSGYGNCRVTATAVRHCWRVQHYNSQDVLILDSIEITEVPVAVLAAQEDLDDSAQRLAEILEALF
ncbi:hydrogenase expression/formation protein [uncultured Thiodictyon sp.]|uniref:hydrogenase expression/formation protein n=1 Tax=uncultured Thiodictyon sp. TaxID=1846217 RepID=UPI0025D350DF|nr:hydrogenase expression/formation protein [uncultured Thiodictyon sp.]